MNDKCYWEWRLLSQMLRDFRAKKAILCVVGQIWKFKFRCLLQGIEKHLQHPSKLSNPSSFPQWQCQTPQKFEDVDLGAPGASALQPRPLPKRLLPLSLCRILAVREKVQNSRRNMSITYGIFWVEDQEWYHHGIYILIEAMIKSSKEHFEF